MASVQELIQKIASDKELQKEVSDILADGKVSMQEIMAFASKYGAKIPLNEIPQFVEQLKGMLPQK